MANEQNTLDAVLNDAKQTNSYLVTVTVRKPNGEFDVSSTGVRLPRYELQHHVFQQNFPFDDISPSMDQALRSITEKHQQILVIGGDEKEEKKNPGGAADESIEAAVEGEFVEKVVDAVSRPLRLAIFTHFNRAPDSYSPARAVKHQIELLKERGHTVVFFCQDGSKLDWGTETRAIMPRFKREKNVINEAAKEQFKRLLQEHLGQERFDLAITHDFYIDDCITYREAIRECGVKIEWLHWARSGVGAPLNFAMPNARYVYMNDSEKGRFAQRIGASPDQIRVVYNEKDPATLFAWHPTTRYLAEHLRLYEKDILQVYPICTTRMDAKGIDSVIGTFAALKKRGHNPLLLICNSNGRRRVAEIESKLDYAAKLGLEREYDIAFTSLLDTPDYPLVTEAPHRVVVDLMRIANLFIFPSQAEVCSNVLLEASMAGNLIVPNSSVPAIMDFICSDAVLEHDFGSLSGRSLDSLALLADKIGERLNGLYSPHRQMRYVWGRHRREAIYEQQLKPILYERL